MRIAISAASCLIDEGIRVKVDTWINQQHRKGRKTLCSRLKLTFKKAIRWRKSRKRRETQSAVASLNEWACGEQYDAGMSDTKLAKRRLRAARVAFEAAAEELKAAERGMKHAVSSDLAI